MIVMIGNGKKFFYKSKTGELEQNLWIKMMEPEEAEKRESEFAKKYEK